MRPTRTSEDVRMVKLDFYDYMKLLKLKVSY